MIEPIESPFGEYANDAWHRSVLFLDVLRQRGNIFRSQQAKVAPHVLQFAVEVVIDGRTLPRPVNYVLVRIVPPEGSEIDPDKRPFIVVDPRAGHGPGIGGMKPDSEIGVALAAGHPCYFVGFTPEPLPGQTIEDVWNAEAAFVEEVVKLHPGSPSKPAIIANCQAGWQTMIMAATRPELAGPILLAGSPLSYWTGVRGKNPMRYAGGLLGGTWITALAGDLGAGKFDGAALVSNFESLNPANTHWDKPYNVYANVGTEKERFLDFETWWGSPILLNAEEMQWIADNLFVGNKLANGKLRTREGTRVDLRNVQSPIVVFASWGDDITPPQQALGWITDLYSDDEDLEWQGQTIVYSLHPSIGHLGIFVSGKVASKEHDEFVNAMDMLDMLPPGIYEAMFDDIDEHSDHRELIEGGYLFRLEPRSLADIRALGGNSPEDDLMFAAVARVSNINLQLYNTFLAPIVRAVTTPASAKFLRDMHPNRLRFAMFSDDNPVMAPVAAAAEDSARKFTPVSPLNPLAEREGEIASGISAWLRRAGEERDKFAEKVFELTYGSPLLHALVGLDAEQVARDKAIARDVERDDKGRKRRDELATRFDKGGMLEAVLRAAAYVRIGEKGIDERHFAMMRQIYESYPEDARHSPAELKHMLREQRALVRLDEKRAIGELPSLLGGDGDLREKALATVRSLVLASGPLSAGGKRRLARVERAFAAPAQAPAARKSAVPEGAVLQ